MRDEDVKDRLQGCQLCGRLSEADAENGSLSLHITDWLKKRRGLILILRTKIAEVGTFDHVQL